MRLNIIGVTVINLLTDSRITEIEERITTLQKLITLDLQTLINEVKEYKSYIASLKKEADQQEVNEKWEHLPPLLTVKDIISIMGISKNHAYKLVNSNQFPIKRVGQLVKIPRNGFISWLEEKCN